MKKAAVLFSSVFSSLLFFFSCATAKDFPSSVQKNGEENITLLFAGDIMAHTDNFRMKDYSLIWNDVKAPVRNADLSFANLEAPVMDGREWENYPTFNMHSDYVEEAISAGFNVFSLANNHSNDQGKSGIISTGKTFLALKEKHKDSEREIYFSGIKDCSLEKKTSGGNTFSENGFDYASFEKNGFKILFLAVTELLNIPSDRSLLNYVSPTDEGFRNLSCEIKALSEKENPDIFILSVHSSEEEYVFKVAEKRRETYRNYLDSGADIVWANHPHVIREYEIHGNRKSGDFEKIVFYGNGNTVSGQRRNPDYRNPENPRDNTGDGLMFEVKFSKDGKTGGSQAKSSGKDGADGTSRDRVFIKETKAYFITTFIDKERNFILKNLNDAFIQNLEDEGKKNMASYYSRRKEISESTKETAIWR